MLLENLSTEDWRLCELVPGSSQSWWAAGAAGCLGAGVELQAL